jgi:hypothetical protein
VPTATVGGVVGFIVIGVVIVLSVAGLLLAGRGPRDRDRGGFEDHPGPDRLGPY